MEQTTEDANSQVLTMLQKMMERMEQDKHELNERINHIYSDIKDEVNGVKKGIIQTSNRLYYVEEAIKKIF